MSDTSISSLFPLLTATLALASRSSRSVYGHPQYCKDFLIKKDIGYVVHSIDNPGEIAVPLNRLVNTGDLISFATADVQEFPGQRLEPEQDTAIKSTQRSLALVTDRYRLGINPYRNVITVQTTLFSNLPSLESLNVRDRLRRVFGRVIE